jgi:hypothetical protein
MMSGRSRAALCAAAVICISFDQVWAQGPDGRDREPSAGSLQQPAEIVRPEISGQTLVTPDLRLATPQTPAPSVVTGQQPTPALAIPPPGDRVMPQGFSVVLVLADLTASGAQDDVPPAARQALADMKDFLPYKSYRLLDAAWLLGQGSMSVRLRGPEEQEYDLRLVASPQPSRAGQVSVQFSLRDPSTYEYALEPVHQAQAEVEARAEAASARTIEIKRRQEELTALRNELRRLREKQEEAKARELEAKIREAEKALADERREIRVTSPRKAPFANRGIIDTSFMMNVGETVVVGTSRLKGNSRALIALLTAVPPKKSRLNER